jgi:hypothetical protein
MEAGHAPAERGRNRMPPAVAFALAWKRVYYGSVTDATPYAA